MTGPAPCVDIYWARVGPDLAAAFAGFLSPLERARMGRFHFEPDRAAYAVAHGLLRQVIGPDRPRPFTGDFVLGPHGKPGLPPTAGPEFNLSHTRTLVAVAVCRDAPVGIDVEALSRPVDGRELAASVLSPREAEDMAATGWPSGDFLARWVMKEALAKAVGLGLRANFRAITLAGDPLQIVELPDEFGQRLAWSTASRVVDNHVVTAAVPCATAEWRWHGVATA